MEISNNKRQYRYEAITDTGELATLEYRWLRGSMALMHTIVPPSAEGKGVGSALVKHVLDEAREKGLKILPYCSFVAGFIKNHPEYQDLVDTSFTR